MIKPWNVPTSLRTRPTLKIKIAEFSELPSGKPPNASEHAFQEYVLSMMNTNRLAAASSKIGAASRCELWGEIATEATADCLEELSGESGDDTSLGDRFGDQLFCIGMDLLQTAAACGHS